MAVKHSVSIKIIESCETIDGEKKPADGKQVDKKDKLQDVSYWNSLHFFGILAACCLSAAVLFFIPRHNSILYPDFWYETLFYFIMAISSRHSISHIQDLFIFTKVQDLLRTSHFLKVFLTNSLSWAVPYCMAYLIWTIWLGKNHPMPHMGATLLFGDISVNFFSYWYFFLREPREQETSKKQAKAFLILRLWTFTQIFVRAGLSKIARSTLQLLLALLIPLTRNFGIWVAERILEKFPEANNEDVRFLLRTEMMISYTNYLTGRITSLNPSTIYGIFIMELALHIISCYKIASLNNKIETDDKSTVNTVKINERNENIQTLVMCEFTEAVVPVAFVIVFTMVFFGPNADLINGVRSNYFGGNVIQDVEVFYLDILQMLAFDVFVMIVSTIFLKYRCNIDLFQEFCNVMKKYWIIFFG